MKNNVLWKAAIYLRLSIDDKDNDISNSIINQEKIIRKHIKDDNTIKIYDTYKDDGFTGTNFNRPSFKEMLEDIKKGLINCVIVKDLSRFGREYIETGNFLEKLFPSYNVRFISVTQNIDSYKNKHKMTSIEIPFLSLINEQYAIDISNKTRASIRAKSKSGKFVNSHVPYGYKRSLKDKNQLLIDNVVSDNVVDIFKIYLSGISIKEIAKVLNNKGSLSPIAYMVQQGYRNLAKNADIENYHMWTSRHIITILKCELYTGDMVQCKTTSYSHKSKKRIPLPKDQWVIVKNTHEPIITHVIFKNASELLNKHTRTIVTTKTQPSMLSGYLFCADCGKPMVRNISTKKGKQYKKFLCSTNKKFGKEVCSSHYINEKDVLDYLSEEIDRYLAEFEVNNLSNKTSTNNSIDKSLALIEKEIFKANKKIEELKEVLAVLYVDYKNNEIDKDDYSHSKDYFKKQLNQLTSKVTNIELQKQETFEQKKTYKKYISEIISCRKNNYLTKEIIILLIDKIIINQDNSIKVIFKQKKFNYFNKLY